MKNHNYAVIMAGGIGSRFWPVSTQTKPKQFQDILGCGKTLLQITFSRLNKIIPANQIYIVTNENYENFVLDQLPEICEDQVVLEPVMRNTAPCILLAAMKIFKIDPLAKMIVAPSDHWIQREDDFRKDILSAFEAIEDENKLITFGIRPDFPNTGFGYIEYDNTQQDILFKVKRFTEKPDYQTAVHFIDAGNYLWNSGIFVWRASTIIDCFEHFLPATYEVFQEGWILLNTFLEGEFLYTNFPLAENISIDYAIIEKASTVHVIPASFGWNDLGTWGSIQNELPQDNLQNTVVNSRFIPEQSIGNIVRTSKDKVVFVQGLSDYLILEDSEILVIVPKKNQQEIKQIRERVVEQFGAAMG